MLYNQPLTAAMPLHEADPLAAGPWPGTSTLLDGVRTLLSELEEGPLGPALPARLEELAGRLAGAAVSLEAPRQAALEATPPDVSERAILSHPDHEVAHQLPEFVIYDRYFQVRRVEGLTREAFTAQLLRTVAGALADMGYAPLWGEDYEVTLESLAAMLGRIGAHPAGDALDLGVREAWGRLEPLQPARFRWVNGHHWFGLVSTFCRLCLSQCNRLAAEQPAIAADALLEATLHLRASTTAMAVATAFPRRIYQQVLRPSLEGEHMPGGFSGAQNPDYYHLKTAKAELRQTLRRGYGHDPLSWPTPLFEAMRRFHEADLLDLDRHILIAADKVRDQPSLAQADFLKSHPEAPRKSAVDHLRELAEMRRREFVVGEPAARPS